MKQLRNAIMRSFVLYFLGLSITGGLIEEFFNQLEEPEEIKEVSGIIYRKSVTANELLDLMFQYTK